MRNEKPVGHDCGMCISLHVCVDEPDVDTLPHTKVYSDDDETYFSDEESGNIENENVKENGNLFTLHFTGPNYDDHPVLQGYQLSPPTSSTETQTPTEVPIVIVSLPIKKPKLKPQSNFACYISNQRNCGTIGLRYH